MKEKDIEIPKISWDKVALVFGLLFLIIGVYWAGYVNGYNYVKEHKENYISKMCVCREPSKNNIVSDIYIEDIDFKNVKID